MVKTSGVSLTRLELDTLREIAGISACHASTALSEMSKKKVNVAFPSIQSYRVEDIPRLIGKPHELVATVYLDIKGLHEGKEFPVGAFLLVFPKTSALTFTNLLQDKKNDDLTELDKDALKETGNILSGACFSILTQFLKFRMIESLPFMALDMLNATLDSILAKVAYKSEIALVFKTDFKIEEHEVKSYFLLLFDPEVYSLLLEKIKEAHKEYNG